MFQSIDSKVLPQTGYTDPSVALLSPARNIESMDTSADTRREKLVMLAFFGVTVTLIPLAQATIIFAQSNTPVDLNALLGAGQLILPSAGLAAATLGECIFAKGMKHGTKCALIGAGLILFLVCIMWYFGLQSTASDQARDLAAARTTTTSFVLYPLSLVFRYLSIDLGFGQNDAD